MPETKNERSWWDNFLDYYLRPSTDFLTLGLSEIGWQNRDAANRERDEGLSNIISGVKDGSISPVDAQGQIANAGYNLSAEQEKWLDNLISGQRTQEARNYDMEMSNTDLVRAAQQLQQLGLSASGVLQTGGSASAGVGTASNAKSNVALEKYQQRMNLARQLLSMTSSMASAGVYGNALSAAKKTSAMLAAQTAHSARMVTRYDGNDQRIGRTISETLDPDFDWNRLF